ncbi:MAG: DUF2752 domain-containing protein [Chloroflexi bacterium]|nr:MAG: DUF2752 domain-containing protein [Chloroflexota bacterium]
MGVWNLSLARAGAEDRVRYALALVALLVWLLYTRVFWALSSVHATLPPCPFRLLTGQPCPFCGGTRSFAQMWDGDLLGAARYHPLGPALFALSLIGVVGLAVLLAGGRALRWRPVPTLEQRVYLVGLAVVLSAWLFRLLFLPLPR